MSKLESKRNLGIAAEHYRRFIEAMGLDSALESAEKTAQRATELIAMWTSSVNETSPTLSTMPAPANSGWIGIEHIQFYSYCEHDMVPFFGIADLIFLPNEKIAGFGGFARFIDYYSRKPQIQEQLCQEIADAIDLHLQPKALLLRLSSRQLCLEMRGRGAGILCTSYAERGLCSSDPQYLRIAQERLGKASIH
ncbi:MAG: GTP cyclohydrolase I [Bradymonadales bacterium]|jgi:GTP cyclohydrolase I